jgi:hypothetical protein
MQQQQQPETYIFWCERFIINQAIAPHSTQSTNRKI